MTPSPERLDLLNRMEEARRQTQRQLNMIDRQITRRMTALIPSLGRKQSGYRRGKPPDPGAFLERYRARLAALTAERQPEIDALARKLARQDHAIEALRQRLGIDRDGRPAARHEHAGTTMDHHDAGPASALWPETGALISR
ncbi:hypothetical protein [Xanthobacter sp. VNH20]|uniref:hypothetical protein n=1 Tax=Xanthobacter sp. VNH20 TaxID=3156616 RepID=UPI0029A890AB|nr:hypothetical protein [Bosea sp. (in: a-proteobacteria)]